VTESAPATTPGDATSPAGAIVALHVCPGPGSRSTLRPVQQVAALEQRGLDGDRHARAGSHRQVLLVELEVLQTFGLAPGMLREQVTVSGLALDTLAPGARLVAGSALLEVAGPCAPCARMDEIEPGLRQRLDGCRGRFVSVVRGGTFAVGDVLRPESPA